jgi:hypothetical protein
MYWISIQRRCKERRRELGAGGSNITTLKPFSNIAGFMLTQPNSLGRPTSLRCLRPPHHRSTLNRITDIYYLSGVI